jgi:hypothetical protein
VAVCTHTRTPPPPPTRYLGAQVVVPRLCRLAPPLQIRRVLPHHLLSQIGRGALALQRIPQLLHRVFERGGAGLGLGGALGGALLRGVARLVLGGDLAMAGGGGAHNQWAGARWGGGKERGGRPPPRQRQRCATAARRPSNNTHLVRARLHELGLPALLDRRQLRAPRLDGRRQVALGGGAGAALRLALGLLGGQLGGQALLLGGGLAELWVKRG